MKGTSSLPTMPQYIVHRNILLLFLWMEYKKGFLVGVKQWTSHDMF